MAWPAVGRADHRDACTGPLTTYAGRLSVRAGALVLTQALVAGTLSAQDTTTAAAPAPLGPRCNGETISYVIVDRQEPVMVERSAGWLRPFLRFALSGAPTRESAVRPFLLVRVGGVCT
jgi:hypothetical protein